MAVPFRDDGVRINLIAQAAGSVAALHGATRF